VVDFWKEYGEGYILFSQLFSYENWQTILSRIASEISNVRSSASVSILDVGSGYGINILNILQMLYSEKKVRHILDVVEPSEQARLILRALIPNETLGGFLRNVYSSIADISVKVFDAVLVMHSSYYIDSFETELAKIYNQNVTVGGLVILLALPDTSPFFLQRKELYLPNTSTRIKGYLNREGIEYKTFALRSRFLFPNKIILSKKGMNALYKFMTRGLIPEPEFIVALDKLRSGEAVDFGDELIVIRK